MSDAAPQPPRSTKHYFVDEAGDGTLFDKKGRIIIGEEGCSKFFMIGLADIDDATAIKGTLEKLGFAVTYRDADLRRREINDMWGDFLDTVSEGDIVEIANSDEIYARPHHPYTRKLLASMPRAIIGADEHPV